MDTDIKKRKLFTVKDHIVLAVFAAAAMILTYDNFFGTEPQRFGLNIPLVYLLFEAVIFLLKKDRGRYNADSIIMTAFGTTFSLSFLFFNNGLVLFFNGIGILVSSAVQIKYMFFPDEDPKTSDLNVSSLIKSFFVRPFHKIGVALSEAGDKKNVLFIILGVIIALPVASVFAVLLSSSNRVFDLFIHSIIRFDSFPDMLGRILFFIAVFLFSASTAYSCISGAIIKNPEKKDRKALSSYIPIYMVLFSVLFILLSYSVIQIVYLFFGTKLTSGLPCGITYSEYAHEGFYELCIAAALIYVVYAVCSGFTKNAAGKNRLMIRMLYTLLMVCGIILSASSFYRLYLYEKAFHFTRLRLYVQFFVSMLAFINVLVMVHIWKNDFKIIKSVLITAFAFTLALTYFNVDRFIAEQNVLHISVNDNADFTYLTELSEDAIPFYIERYEDMLGDHTDITNDSVLTELYGQLWHLSNFDDSNSKKDSPLYFNFGRQKAREYSSEISVICEKLRDIIYKEYL